MVLPSKYLVQVQVTGNLTYGIFSVPIYLFT